MPRVVTFETLNHGVRTIQELVGIAYKEWDRGDESRLMSSLDEIVYDTETLAQQAKELRNTLASKATGVKEVQR